MRAILQRVQYARLTIDQSVKSKINLGLLVFIGIEQLDTIEDANWLAGKISRIRVFNDQDDKMNLSVQDVNGEIMVVSQFTLHASTKKGNRPSWIKAADPEVAEPLYMEFVNLLQESIQKKIKTGKFGAHMNIELLNDGPVTIFIDSRNKE
jgi:D-tyrosyl-tRNA(Tyr) deacylase